MTCKMLLAVAILFMTFKTFSQGGNEAKGGPVCVSWKSIIIPYSKQKDRSYGFGSGNGITQGVMNNQSIKEMYMLLYAGTKVTISPNGYPILPASRIVFHDIDTTKMVSKLNGAKQLQNLYSMKTTANSIFIPIDSLHKRMAEELDECFDLKSEWKIYNKKCLVISKNGKELPIYTEGKRKWTINNQKVSLNNITIEEFIGFLNEYFENGPIAIIDETNFTEKLGMINVAVNHLNIENLNEVFGGYGMRFSIENRDVAILVISKKMD